MVLSDIQIFQSLKNKLGEKEAKDLIEFIEAKSEEAFANKSEAIATKKDVSLVKEDLLHVKEELKSDMHSMESRLSSKIYTIGLVQLIAIIGSVIGIMALFVK